MEFTKRQAEMMVDLVQDAKDTMESLILLDNMSRRTLLPPPMREKGELDIMELEDALQKLKERANSDV